MRSITKDARRATQDLDIDLIRYFIEDIAIKKIIDKMNGIEDIEVSVVGNIKKLNQQDYRGLEKWQKEKGYLRDTCLMGQDKIKKNRLVGPVFYFMLM